MLRSLHIENFKLFRDTTLDFHPGLNIVTGETGSGKSMLIKAISLLSGDRASTDSVRHGENKAIVEGNFHISTESEINNVLNNGGYESFGPELLIRREISSKGNSRAFINDSPANAGLLKKIAFYLVDFHGQHGHQSLLRPELHLSMLDSTGDYAKLLGQYRKSYNQFTEAAEAIISSKKEMKLLNEKKDYLEFQLKQLVEISPKQDEDIELERDLKILENSEELLQNSGEVYSLLYDGEINVRDLLAQTQKNLQKLEKIDDKFAEFREELEKVIISVSEVSDFLNNYINGIDLDTLKAESMRKRLFSLKDLSKKYGSLNQAIEASKKIREELEKIENSDNEIGELDRQLNSMRDNITGIALELSSKRKSWAEKLSSGIINNLKELGIENASFECKFTQSESKSSEYFINDDKKSSINETGIDKLEFYISTNTGEKLRPLHEVASGGEVSRIMLAIKSIIAATSGIPILVFDEIDTGISGKIAQKAGARMKRLSKECQIIAISHLPQIAAFGDLNLLVEKSETAGRTISDIRLLDNEAKTLEIAKLLSGHNISETSLNSANELIRAAQN